LQPQAEPAGTFDYATIRVKRRFRRTVTTEQQIEQRDTGTVNAWRGIQRKYAQTASAISRFGQPIRELGECGALRAGSENAKVNRLDQPGTDMTLPLIAITTDYREMHPYMWHATPNTYVDAVTDVSGALPMLVPSIGDRLDIDSLLDRVDGVLVTGSRTNVHPSNYGMEPTADHEPFDPDRDATTLPLIRRTIERGVPLLAICRGFQELNVALGGSITAEFQKHRQIEGHDYPPDGPMDERFAISHPVSVKPDSTIAKVLETNAGDDETNVNSLHTQALDRLADALLVEATAHDGTIEAVTVKDAPGFVVGVQWHPEYWARTDGPSNKILSAFGDAARQYAETKGEMLMAAE